MSNSPPTEFLAREDGHRIAYHRLPEPADLKRRCHLVSKLWQPYQGAKH